ncbi:MAG: cytochrome [Streptosporangiaceae bacterium]|nr:cytochrome [Streptosporangiaceae bacterium]
MSADLTPKPDDLLDLDELPMADDRTRGYAILCEAGPVARAGDGYVLTCRDAADQALKEPGVFSSALTYKSLGSAFQLIPLTLDPPDHTRVRRVLQPFFTPRTAARLLEPLRAQLSGIIDGFIARGSCDVVEELAVPFPADAFLALFGLPLEDRDRLIGWKDAILDPVALTMAPAEAKPETVRGATELYLYLNDHIAVRTSGTGEDVLTNLLADDSDEALSHDEILGLCFLFVLAGLDTVTSSLSTMFATLATRPDLRRRIVADPSIIPDAVEELIRYDPAVPVISRVVVTDTELYGRSLPAGTPVMVSLGAANRDAAVHGNPDSIDFGRQDRNLTFGGGPHRCLGVHLARMELRLVLQEWHRRIPEYELAPGVRPRVNWPAGTVGIDHVPLVWEPGD